MAISDLLAEAERAEVLARFLQDIRWEEVGSSSEDR
jgi:hypothetical protein